MEYPQEWNQLPKHERKKKIKEMKRQQEEKGVRTKKITNWVLVGLVLMVLVGGYKFLTKEDQKQIALEATTSAVSLEGKVEEFPIEGKEHVGTDVVVDYKTNPPTSGSHLANPEDWGVNDEPVDDRAAVHSLEHGGIWITYKDIGEDEIKVLEEIYRKNSQSVLVSPRAANDVPVAVVSWGKMMKLEGVDEDLIQKYIDIYKNQSPEPLAR